MTTESWYASRENRQIGPVDLETLQQMVTHRELRREDLVWQVGTPSWIPASQVSALCDAAGWGSPQVPSLPPAPRVTFEDRFRPHLDGLRDRVGELDRTAAALHALPHLRFMTRMVDAIGRQITARQLDAADRWMKRTGSIAYMLAAVLYCVFFAVMSLRADSLQRLLATLLIVIPGASLGHFVAIYFMESGESMLRQTPTELSSKSLALTAGLFSGALGFLMLVVASRDLFRKVAVEDALWALPLALTLLYGAASCLNPASLNLRIHAGAAAPQEAIGMLMFIAKVPLRLIPVAFGSYALLAMGSAGYFCYRSASGENPEQWFVKAIDFAPQAMLCGLLPMALYLASVLAQLIVGVLQASLDTAAGIRGLEGSTSWASAEASDASEEGHDPRTTSPEALPTP